MRRVRAWLRAVGPLRLLDDCAASMLIETGAEDHLRHALDQRPSLIQRIALKIVLRAVRRQQARAAQPTEAPRLVDSEAAVAPQHPVPEERRAAAGG